MRDVLNTLISVSADYWLKTGNGKSRTQQALQAVCRLHGSSLRIPIMDTRKL